jgi:cyanophycin synthetase
VSSVDEAVHAADDLGYPVVVKPREGNHGRGVSIDLKDRAGVAAAFDIANAEGDGVIVEQCIAGDHHRLLVVGNRVVAAAQGEPDHVMGDGQRTIRQLVDWGNAQPNRGDPEIHPHDRLKLDPIALDLLKRQGLTVDSVPVIGRRVVLHYNGDLTTDVTSRVHPEVARVAVLAARTVGLNVAGIDLVLSDVGRPVEEQHGAVLEVNASPSLLMHVKPLRGEPQPVGEAIVDDLFPSAKNGRIPIVAVSGTSGKSSVIALLEGMLAGLPVPPRTGVACSDGLWVGERALQSAPSTDYESVSNLLVNPIVDLAIVEMEPLTVLEQGIAFDQCQVAVVTNLGSSDHLGLDLVDRDRMVLVERCGVDMVLPFGTAVLTADDPDVLAMIPKCPGKILLFSRDGDGSEVVTHRQRGGRTVAVCGTLLRFHEGASCLVEIPVPVELADYELENLLAALGAAWALGVSPAALATHVPGAFTRAPRGVEAARRVRTLELDGRTVAVGLPRNPLAARAAIEWVKRLSRDGKPFARRIALQTDLPRDWRDEDAFTMGSLYGQFFQEVRLREETQTPKENLAAKAIANGRPAAGLGAAFERGVRSANHAEFAFWHPGKVGDWRGVVRGLSPDDLLFVQVGNSQSFASFPLPEEGQTDSGSSSAATRSNSHEGSLAEV